MGSANRQADSVPSPDYGASVAVFFVPRRGLRSGHLQTLASHFLRQNNNLPAPDRRTFEVETGVRVLCLCHWQEDKQSALTVLLVHGLEGSCDSKYVIGTANKAWAAGMNVVRMNVRTCGGTEKLANTLYHSGMSQDVSAVVQALIAQEGLRRVALAGFSMGGNQVLKLAGEWGERPPHEVKAIAAVSPAIDLAASAAAIHLPENRLYELRFLLSLRRRLRRLVTCNPGKFVVPSWWWRSIEEFDDIITAPNSGFASGQDYYNKSSASHLVDRIALPTLILYAADDPFIRLLPETRAKLAANPHVRFVETAHGGHCGFLAARNHDDGRWAEHQIVNFFRNCADH